LLVQDQDQGLEVQDQEKDQDSRVLRPRHKTRVQFATGVTGV